MKKALVCSALILIMTIGLAGTAPAAQSAVRFWGYFNLTTLLSKNLAIVLMPGYRHELSRTEDAVLKDNFFNELFIGPVYIMPLSKTMKLKLGLWYYYMGFPIKKEYNPQGVDDIAWSHNIEFLPILEIKLGNMLLINRLIFHNKIWANAHKVLFNSTEDEGGYSMTIRWLEQLVVPVGKSMSVHLGDEIFYGVIENTGGTSRGEPFFENAGLYRNRLYVGGTYAFSPFFKLTLQYIWEANWNPTSGEDTGTSHYIQATINYVLKLF